MALLFATLQVRLCNTVTAQLYARPRNSVSLHRNSFLALLFRLRSLMSSAVPLLDCALPFRSIAVLCSALFAIPFHRNSILFRFYACPFAALPLLSHAARRFSGALPRLALLLLCAAFAKQCPPLPRFTVSTLFYSMRGISSSMLIRSSPHLALATLRRTEHFRRLAQSNLAIPSLNFFPRKTPLAGTAPLPEA